MVLADVFGIFRESRNVQQQIFYRLVNFASQPQAIETRAIALRSLGTLITRQDLTQSPDLLQSVAVCCASALNDYTINERGDIGALLRSEALRCVFPSVMRSSSNVQSGPSLLCYLSAVRLSLEKLDKLRLEALNVFCDPRLEALPWMPFDRSKVSQSLPGVSSDDHFSAVAAFLSAERSRTLSSEVIQAINKAILEGLLNSAGSGSSTILPIARSAFADALDHMDEYPSTSQGTNCSLFGIAEIMTNLIQENHSNERVLIPALELLAFILETGSLHRLSDPKDANQPRFKFRTLLSHVQKAHFKSSSMPKLLAAVSVYRGLADFSEIQEDVLTKLVGMLAHPFPAIRLSAAETLWATTGEQKLLSRDWRAPIAKNKDVVLELREACKKRGPGT